MNNERRKTMKKFLSSILLVFIVISMLFMTACGDDVQDIINNNTKTPLSTPTNLRVEGTTLLWNSVEYASGYTVLANDTTYTANSNSFSLENLRSGEYVISVKANGDGILYTSSAYSNTITYTRQTSSGNEYSDQVIAAFREFDEINTKNSFLGYGIDIINASAITSKNVLMTYPIFNMDKLMDENLLKSNEHYNSFESIEASTIEEFSKNMSTSTSITSGSNVSAKGNIYGVNVSASASLSSGLTTSFTKTSDLVESQYFLEIIAENQSYWLVLQTSEQRYKELLSDEFKSDLYNVSITPAQLFEKYGTHMLTSVAMGGNICMYYTMYSYDKTTTTSNYAEVSSTLKTNVEAAYGGYSAGVGTENSFNKAYTYETVANSYGIHIDKKIISAGGGSFGINNEATLYENYYDWQKSLDTYPVVIGIKDTNSLYPIWNLIDLNIEGAQDRYTELYNYFQQYGADSYNNLCETYSITPSVAPTAIENITVGEHTNYAENQVVNVKSGDTLQISFDVAPHNANKYLKTFTVDNTTLATIDDTGLLTISPTAPGGSYIKVTITAGSISKQITLYVINTYNVSFNTRVADLNVAPIYGIFEGYTIDEPQLHREGYILEGWYTDTANTNKFDFENDSVTSHMTLYAKWVAIKPVVSFDTGDGSAVATQTLSYNSTATKPKNPTLTGYTFGGWYADEECTEEFDFETLIVADITLYAKWNIIEYTVTFITNGGTPIAPLTTSIKDSYKVTEPMTTRQYYTLDGWYKDEYFTQKFYFETEITVDTTLYAKWTAEKASVSFVDTDGVSSVYDEFGAIITARATDIENEFKITAPTPYKEGYTFVGWSLDGIIIDAESYAGFKPKADGYVLSARWTINKYTITFETLGGSSIKPITQNYGTSIKAPADPTKEGYTFAGWNVEIPATMPAEDIIITAEWSINKYTITFNTNGGSEIASITKNFGDSIISPANPTKEGYTFIGWDAEIPATMPAEDMTINANWQINQYNITFVIDNEEFDSITYNYSEEIVYPEVNVTGYTFSGWKYGLKDVPATMPAKDIVVSGTLTVNNYKLSYYVDGELYQTKTYAYGASITLIAEPTADGKVFSGWVCSTTEIMPTTMPAFDVRIDGGFDQTTFHIYYYIDDILVETESINKGFGINAYVPDSKPGYSFSGWFVKDGDTTALLPSVMPANDIYAYGSYTINQYTITFNTNGGSEIASITKNYGESINKPANPTKVGYTFAGWNVEIPATMPAKDMTINAIWQANRYTITFNTNGGTVIAPIIADYGSAIVAPKNPTKVGYTFIGWDAEIPATMPAENLIITAEWSINKYTITFNTNGGSEIASITKNYGESIDKPANPTKVGYTFAGWNVEIPATMPAENLIITAEWSINKYTITFNTNGGNKIPSITQDYGTAIVTPADPTREGYTFIGWDAEIPATMPAENLIITAEWSINRYTITFNTNGGTYIAPIIQDYGTAIIAPSNPTRTGYRFDGWDAVIPATMPADNLTINAEWTLYSANINYIINSETTVDGEETKGSFVVRGNVTTVSYNVTQLNDADAEIYSKYYDFLGWYTEPTGGIKLADSNGTLLANVAGYTNSEGKWIRESFYEITLYAQWKQTYAGYTYIEGEIEFNNIFASSAALSGKYLLVKEINLGERMPIGTYTWAHIKSHSQNDHYKNITSVFSGTLNGGGNKITYSININKNSVKIENCYSFALFGSAQNATFEDIKISAIVKNTNTNFDTNSHQCIMGGLVGNARNCKFIDIEVLKDSEIWNYETDHFWYAGHTKMYMSATYAGGIVAEADGCEFYNCINNGTVHSTGWCAYAGGIAGNAYNCTFDKECKNTEAANVTAVAQTRNNSPEAECSNYELNGYLYGKKTHPCCMLDGITRLDE